MDNAEYWARRCKIMQDAIKDKAFDYAENLEKQFDTAIAQIDTQMRAWYQRFADNNGITYAKAQKMLTSDELKEFKWTVQEYIEKCKESSVNGAWVKELENASARVHISRLDSLKIHLRQQAEVLTDAAVKTTTDASKLAYTQSYYHTAFEVQKGLGVGWTMQGLNNSALEKVLSRPWTVDERTFTARCWTDKAKLVETVNREITRMIATGESPNKAIANIAKRFNVSKSNAGRVVMTESAYFASAAQKDCFNELGVERYKVIAALDEQTCDICSSMDGKVFKMSEYQEGATAPPFHPWCRCCTAPYFEDMEGLGTRFARDVVTGEAYEVPRNMTYEEWNAKQDEKHGDGTVDKKRKMTYNENADSEQYGRYIELLGNNAPTTFADFQSIKYSDDWGNFKAYARAINSGELTPLADFKLYTDTSKQIDSLLVGKVTSNGLDITGKTYHFIARTIGSVEQKRNGVTPNDALDAITNPLKVDPVKSAKNGNSQRFKGKNCYVTLNPDTGVLIQTNPHKGGLK